MKFHQGDIVKFIENNKTLYGEFIGYDKQIGFCTIVCGVARETHFVLLPDVFYVEPISPTCEDLKKLVRFEISNKQFFHGEKLAKVLRTALYSVTFDDLLVALHNMKKSGNQKRINDYFFLCNKLDYILLWGDEDPYEGPNIDGGVAFVEEPTEEIILPPREKGFEMNGLLSDENVLHHAFFYMEDHLVETCERRFVKEDTRDFSPIILEVERLKNNVGKPFAERVFTDEEKEHFLSYYNYNRHDEVERIDKEVCDVFKVFCEDLAKKDKEDALCALGYGYYGGNSIWPCDWKSAEQIFLHLMEISKDNRFYANTLGYIYYYGRVNHGVNEYEKAYKYFSLAAFGGVYEAQYKIADMYELGLGVPKNFTIAKEIVGRLYDENKKYLYMGAFQSKFADIAFRMARHHMISKNYYSAYFYLLRAFYVIKQRMSVTNYYGDKNVAESISKIIDDCKTKLDKPDKKPFSYVLSHLLISFKAENSLCKVLFSEVENHTATMEITLEKKQFGDKERMCLTLPRVGYCGLTDKIKIKIRNLPNDFAPQKVIVFDDVDRNALTLHGSPVFEFPDCIFEVVLKKGAIQTPHRFISVIFNENSRPYDYLCDCKNVEIGDRIEIETPSGLNVVKVVKIFEKTEDELALPVTRYKRIKEIKKVEN